jgi:hypothetical protein
MTSELLKKLAAKLKKLKSPGPSQAIKPTIPSIDNPLASRAPGGDKGSFDPKFLKEKKDGFKSPGQS